MPRSYGKIYQQCGGSFSTQDFIEADDAVLAGDQRVPCPLPDLPEDRINQGIPEFLRNDCAVQTGKTASHAEPFEIAVVIAHHDQSMFPARSARAFLEILQLDIAREIFPRQIPAPEKID